ncbi:MAG: hypothetical protein ABW148_18345 [Sedimenticola sp.]
MEVTINVVYVVIAAVVLFAVVIYLTTRGKGKTKTKINILKGVATYEGESDHPTMAESVASDMGNEEQSDQALEAIKYIKETLHPEKVSGNYEITETTQANWIIAARLYTKLDGDIISTALFESPYYGESDLASGIRKGASFTRITNREQCDQGAETSLNEVFSRIECDAKLKVLQKNTEISKIGGIFCKFPDSSYVSFIAMNNYGNNGSNQGIVFSGVIAKQLHQYYKSFC